MDDQFLPPKPSGQEIPQNMPGDIIMPGSEPKPDPPFEEYHDPNLYEAAPLLPPSEPIGQPDPHYVPTNEPMPVQAPVPPQPQPQQFSHPGIAIPEEVDEAPAPQPKKRLRIWVLIAIGLLVIVVAAVAAFLILGKKPAKKAETAAKPVANDIQLVRYGAIDGTMNQFAPTLQNNPATLFINKQIFEPLVGFEGGTKTVPILVSGWTTPDSTTWVFNLKSGIRFHTGNTFSAKDVVYSYQQYKNNPAFASQVTSTIKSVDAVADDQIKITTNGADPLLLNRLASLLIVDSTAAGKVDPVYGTGPYQTKPGTTADADHIDLIAFDNFHGGHIYTRELQVTVYRSLTTQAITGQAAALNDMKAGKLDVVGALDGNSLADAKQSNFTTLLLDYPPVYYIIPNTLKKGAPLASQKVRQAVYDTIDVDAVLKAQKIDGKAQSQLVTDYIPGFNSSVIRPTVDTDAAKRLLRDAGYANGTSFTLTLPAQYIPAGTEIVTELKAIGITVKLDPQADANKIQSDGAAGKLEAYWLADSSLYNDASDVYARELQSKNYANPSIDSLLRQAGATINQTDRLNYLQQAAKTAMDDTALIPLYNGQQSWVSSNASYVLSQDLLKNDLGVYFYKVYSKK